MPVFSRSSTIFGRNSRQCFSAIRPYWVSGFISCRGELEKLKLRVVMFVPVFYDRARSHHPSSKPAGSTSGKRYGQDAVSKTSLRGNRSFQSSAGKAREVAARPHGQSSSPHIPFALEICYWTRSPAQEDST